MIPREAIKPWGVLTAGILLVLRTWGLHSQRPGEKPASEGGTPNFAKTSSELPNPVKESPPL